MVAVGERGGGGGGAGVGAQVSHGASANVESKVARTPHFISLAYNVPHARILRLTERYRQYMCLSRVLHHVDHSTRHSGSDVWLAQNSTSGKEKENKTLLHDQVRRAGTHTMHLPFQTPVLRHGAAPVDTATKFPDLSVLYVVPSDVNGGDVVTWIESTVGDRRTTHPILLLTFADLCEMGEPLLHVMGWVQDCTLVFIPASIFEESLQLLYDVQEARKSA